MAAVTEPIPPSILFRGLFEAVAEARLFADSKHFADAVPRRAAQAIMADYRASIPMTGSRLAEFLHANFVLPGNAATPVTIATGHLRKHIAATWETLPRGPTHAKGSALALDRPHVVPGGRFRELYYWDSYFTLLGLVRDRPEVAQSMVATFTDLIERFGHVPNGTRTYYIGRSQPPVFALMLDLVPTPDREEGQRRLDAAIAEHRFWTTEFRMARLPDGTSLARYWDGATTPRDEAWHEDRETARSASRRSPKDVWRDLRAAAESGWDFSSRWLGDDLLLDGIRTTAIVPVDLNALLYAAELRLAARCRNANRLVEAADLARWATTRLAAMNRWCWVPERQHYCDVQMEDGRPTDRLTAATLFPLFAGAASQEQADAVAAITERRLLASGGLRTSLVERGQQWDAPNGWAPLQWIAVQALRRYGHFKLADRIAAAWLTTVERHHALTGAILEKYDVETGGGGTGGEYTVQAGFGWTNGVCAALIDAGIGYPIVT